MSLHFLLKAEARTRSLVEVLGMSDDDAFTPSRRVCVWCDWCSAAGGCVCASPR
jgi:hypothetical protein